MIDDTYDPELHGTEVPPPPQRWLVAALTTAAVSAPFIVWWLFS